MLDALQKQLTEAQQEAANAPPGGEEKALKKVAALEGKVDAQLGRVETCREEEAKRAAIVAQLNALRAKLAADGSLTPQETSTLAGLIAKVQQLEIRIDGTADYGTAYERATKDGRITPHEQDLINKARGG